MTKTAEQTLVEGLMNKYVSAYTAQNLEDLVALFVDDGQIDIWGTGVDEHKTSIEGFRQTVSRDFKEARTEITVQSLTSFIMGEAGIVMAEWLVRYQPLGETQDSSSHKWQDFPLIRTSFYVEKHGDSWRIRHAHWSTPFQSQPEGKSFPNAA